jgi:hypothetical protein
MAKNIGTFDIPELLKPSDQGDYAIIKSTSSMWKYTKEGWLDTGTPSVVSEGETFPSTTIYVDGNRTDEYTPDGTYEKPFLKFSDALVVAHSAVAINLAPGAYVETGTVSLPAYPITIYGNKSTLTSSGTITVNEVLTVYDLNTVGAVVYAYTGAARSMRIGGSINGAVTIQGGFIHFDSLNYTGTMTITGGTPYFRGMTGGGSIVVNGSSAVVILNDCNLNKANVSSANITVTSGQVFGKGSICINKGDTSNIVFNNTNTITTPHYLTQITCNYGVSCNSAYTIVAPDNIIPVLTGSAIVGPPAIPTFGVGGGTAQVQTATIPLLVSTYYPGMRFSYVVSVSNTGATPTLNVNTLGAKTVIKGTGAAVAAGSLAIGMVAEIIYDGTYLRILNPAA